jgi:hypothetical protein
MTDLDKAKKQCERMMGKLDLIDDGETRAIFELHLQHTYAALDGEKEDLYD